MKNTILKKGLCLKANGFIPLINGDMTKDGFVYGVDFMHSLDGSAHFIHVASIEAQKAYDKHSLYRLGEDITNWRNWTLQDITITKDNIHLYYQFMSDEDLEKYNCVLADVFFIRFAAIARKLTITVGTLDKFSHHESIFGYHVKKSYFGVKDTLKPINEYIEEIKASSGYKEYIKKDTNLLKCYSIIANGVFYFINKQFYFLNNSDQWQLVSNQKKIDKLWELREKSTDWNLVTGSLFESLNKHISTK